MTAPQSPHTRDHPLFGGCGFTPLIRIDTLDRMMQSGHFSGLWGRHTVEANRTDFWQIGPLHLWIQHLPQQWKLGWRHHGDWLDPVVRVVPGSHGEPRPDRLLQEVNCVLGGGAREDIIFTPALPNRPVVTRLLTPLHVPPGESVHLYVISPLWLKIELAEPSRCLQEVPIHRLSDTWFGPVSSLGELCYASSAPALLNVQDAPLRLHCVISAVFIRNLGSDRLRLDRLKVPFPRLSLFYSPRSGFWTDRVILERRDDDEMASLKLDRQPPQEASPTRLVAGPKTGGAEPNSVVRVFSAFFRERPE